MILNNLRLLQQYNMLLQLLLNNRNQKIRGLQEQTGLHLRLLHLLEMKRILRLRLRLRQEDLVVVVVIPLNDTPIVKFLHVVNFLHRRRLRRRRHSRLDRLDLLDLLDLLDHQGRLVLLGHL